MLKDTVAQWQERLKQKQYEADELQKQINGHIDHISQ